MLSFDPLNVPAKTVSQALVVAADVEDVDPVLTVLNEAGIGYALTKSMRRLERVAQVPLLLVLKGGPHQTLPPVQGREAATIALLETPDADLEDSLLQAGVHEIMPLSDLSADALTRLVRRARLRHLVAADADQARKVAYGMLDRLPLGLVLTRPDGRIVHANARAERLLKERRVMRRDRSNTLVAMRPDATRALRAAIKSCATGDDRADGAIALPSKDDGAAGSAIVVPAGDSVAGAALFVADPDAGLSINASRLAGLYGLTRSEALVVARLARGETVEQIAAAGGQQLATIRSQLKSVFRKTATGRQSDLIKLVLSGPAVFTP